MNRLTSKRCNGIKDGYWSPHTKEEIVQRLGSYEDTGMEPEEIRAQRWIPITERLPENPKKAEKPERTAAEICYECRANGDDYWTDGYETVWQCTECPYYDETEEDE